MIEPEKMTMGDLRKRTGHIPDDVPVRLMIEFDKQYEDSLREVICHKDYVLLMGLERI